MLYYYAVPRLNHLLRIIAPSDYARHAELHDIAIRDCFRTLFLIPEEDQWNANLHKLQYDMWIRQSQLP